MYLSRIQLEMSRLKPEMLSKWRTANSYAAHQWLWQLFPDCRERGFLFRQEPRGQFFVLSTCEPLSRHELFSVETKPFSPRLEDGLSLDFQLRANPVICRNNRRNDVMMDAKYQAKMQGVDSDKVWSMQVDAALSWLARQGLQNGFRLEAPSFDEFAAWAGDEFAQDASGAQQRLGVTVQAYRQHQFKRRADEAAISYSSVDYVGRLTITDTPLFERALFQGIGKSKALGCGMLMIKRRQ